MLSRWRAVRMGHRAPGVNGTADSGMSLIELAVGMTLLGVVGAIAINFFVSGSQQTDRVTEESLVAADARVAIENIGSLIQFADTPTARAGFVTGRFEVIAPTRIVFYGNTTAASRNANATRTPPTRIDISVVNGALVQKLYAPKTNYTAYPSTYDYTTNYPTTPSSTVTLLRAVNTPVNAPIFTYCTAATEPAVTCTPALNANTVAAVAIDLTVPGKNGTTAQRVRSVVSITGVVS